MKPATILKGQKGSAQVDTAGSILMISMFLALAISVCGAMIQGITLNSAASDVNRMIETDGKYDTSEQQKITELLSSLHVNATVNVSPQKNYYDLGDTIIVTLRQDSSIGVTGMSILPIPLTGRAGGSSEVYWK